MNKLILPPKVCEDLKEIASVKKLYIEGNILKLIEAEDPECLKEYIDDAIEKDKDNRLKRLEVTKTVQKQNRELIEGKEEREKLLLDLKDALATAEKAKESAEQDLDILQKKTQFELIGSIVSYALYIIAGTGIITTGLYILAIINNSSEITLIGSTWSNLFGILLTNSFSIIGTIMGVKYAEGKKNGC